MYLNTWRFAGDSSRSFLRVHDKLEDAREEIWMDAQRHLEDYRWREWTGVYSIYELQDGGFPNRLEAYESGRNESR